MDPKETPLDPPQVGSTLTCIDENIPNAVVTSCSQGPSTGSASGHPAICSVAATDEGTTNSPVLACESPGIVDWSKLVINVNVDENDDRDVVLEEDAMYEFIGLRAEDERREARSKEPVVNPLLPELENEIAAASMEVDDNVVEDFEYMDEENPTMNVGDTYPTMDAFRMAMRQYAIKGQFDIYTVKSDQTRPNIESFVHNFYSLAKFRAAYEGVVQPITGRNQWPKVVLDFKLLPPLNKRSSGRPKKNRMQGALEKSKSGASKRQVQCRKCGELGHRSDGCHLNGPKKRKKNGNNQHGRDLPIGTPPREFITLPPSLQNSPGPITRRQLALAIDGEGTSQGTSTSTPAPAVPGPSKPRAKKMTPKKKRARLVDNC